MANVIFSILLYGLIKDWYINSIFFVKFLFRIRDYLPLIICWRHIPSYTINLWIKSYHRTHLQVVQWPLAKRIISFISTRHSVFFSHNTSAILWLLCLGPGINIFVDTDHVLQPQKKCSEYDIQTKDGEERSLLSCCWCSWSCC